MKIQWLQENVVYITLPKNTKLKTMEQEIFLGIKHELTHIQPDGTHYDLHGRKYSFRVCRFTWENSQDANTIKNRLIKSKHVKSFQILYDN